MCITLDIIYISMIRVMDFQTPVLKSLFMIEFDSTVIQEHAQNYAHKHSSLMPEHGYLFITLRKFCTGLKFISKEI